MSIQPASVLVTGAPGWLGTRLVEHLAAQTGPPSSPIRCLVVPGADSSALTALSGVTAVTGDVTDADSIARFVEGARDATLIHCAGVIHPRRAAEFNAVNAEGTWRLLAAAEKAGVKRFVYVSSNSPFGANPSPTHVFTEESPYNPYMGYGRSKMLGEQAVIAAGHTGRMESAIIRTPWFYGPGQPPRQTQFFTMIRKGGFPIVGGGNNRRSMSYVDNLCQGLWLATRTEHAHGDVFWIADERPYTMNEIVDTVERVMERDFKIPVSHKRMRLPSIASDVARVADRMLQGVGLYEQKIHVLSEMNLTIACSVDKAKRMLGYRPEVALEEGMRRSLQWVIAQGTKV
jgi:nucleoside-diphosphate-sugar epimerase